MQSASTEPAYPVSEPVLAHLSSVAQQLMKTETELYEKCRHFLISLSLCIVCVCVCASMWL